MSKDGVILLDYWVSPFAIRAKIALAEKGVEYDARNEDLFGCKSELLLKSNPLYAKVPVLIHNGKAVCESTNIVTYIEEAWPTPSLLPPTAYGRSQARFWADYVDKKLFDSGSKIWQSKAEDVPQATKEFLEVLKILEGALGENESCGARSFGFVDIIAIPMTSWFYTYEQFGGFKVEDECPKITAWIKKCKERESVAKFVSDPIKVYEFVCTMKKNMGLE